VRDTTSLVVEQINTNVNTILGHTAKTIVKSDHIQDRPSKIGTDIGSMKDISRVIMDQLQKQHRKKCDNDLYSILRPSQRNKDKMEEILRDRLLALIVGLCLSPIASRVLSLKTN
jgi:hypothetical protein